MEPESFVCLNETCHRLFDRARELHINTIPKDTLRSGNLGNILCPHPIFLPTHPFSRFLFIVLTFDSFPLTPVHPKHDWLILVLFEASLAVSSTRFPTYDRASLVERHQVAPGSVVEPSVKQRPSQCPLYQASSAKERQRTTDPGERLFPS